MTEEEKKKMEELEVMNADLKKKLEEAEKMNDEKGKSKFSDDPDFQKMQKRLEESEKQLRQSRLDSFSDAIKNLLPAGLKEKVDMVAEVLVDAGTVKFSDNGAEKEAGALDVLKDVLSAWPQEDLGRVYNFNDDGKGNGNSGNGWADVAKKI